MRYLKDLITLNVGQHIQVFGECGKRIVGRSCHSYTALKTIRIIAYYTIERIGSAAHGNVPKQPVDMDIYGIRTLCLAFVTGSVVCLTKHHRKITQSRTPFLCYGVSFGCKRKCVLAFGVGKAVGKVGDSIVQSQDANGQLWLLWLFLLVLCSTFLCSPVFFLLQIHLVHLFDFAGPGVYQWVYTALT